MPSAFHYWVWCYLWACHRWPIYYVEVCSLYICFLRVFIIKGCQILSKAFSTSIVIIMWFWFLNLLVRYFILIDFQILNYPFMPAINSAWSCYTFLLLHSWIQSANSLLRNLHLCLLVISACNFLFLWYLCLILVSGWCWPTVMSLTQVISNDCFCPESHSM